MKVDLEKELVEAKKRGEILMSQFQQNLGVISFIEYQLKKEKEEDKPCSPEILSPAS
jgi:hypothetical protein